MLDIVDCQGPETALPLDGLDHTSEEGHVPPRVRLQFYVC